MEFYNNNTMKFSFVQFFNEVFNNREFIPLVVNKNQGIKYDAFIQNINSKVLCPNNNPHLLTKIKDINMVAMFTNNRIKIRKSYKISLTKLNEKYAYFILNAYRFGKRAPDQSNRKIFKMLKLDEYVNEEEYNVYGDIPIQDIRLNYRLKQLSRYLEPNLDIMSDPYVIENLYYINKLRESKFMDVDKRDLYLKKMYQKSDMNSDQISKFNKFVNPDKFNKLMLLLNEVVGSYYITGSVIDFINNNNLKEKEYKDSDIDIVVIDKFKFGLLAGYIMAYLQFTMNLSFADVSNIVSYDGKHLNIKAGYLSDRDIQIYWMEEKYGVFSHHFPCVRGYINNRYKMALSNQAVEIFKPTSNKVVNYVFMFPYTDSEKAKNIIEKYRARGYNII